MLRDNRIPVDGSSIVHAVLQGLDHDDHKQYVLTVGANRVIIDADNPQDGDTLQYDSTANVWVSGPTAESITKIDPASGDIYYYDPTRSKNLGVATIQTDASRNSRNTTNQYLRGEGDTPTNLNGFVLLYNATLIGISMSSDANTQIWSAQARRNESVIPDAFLTSTNQYSHYNETQNIDFNAGDRIQIFCSGQSIKFPKVSLFFRRRF